MAADHSGHFGNGIQAHSAGKTYPWRVLVRGNICVALNGETMREDVAEHFFHSHGKSFLSAYAEAEADCAELRRMTESEAMMCTVPVGRQMITTYHRSEV